MLARVGVCNVDVKSVNLQYGDNNAVDKCEYMDVFEEYKAKGRRIANCEGCGDVKNLGALRKRLTKFFECVLYQIEDEDCAEYASWLAFMCIGKLCETEIEDIKGWWGEIEI